MKNQLVFRVLVLIVFLSITAINVFAQGTGKITGKVTDEKNGETLIGLNVKVVGIGTGASTGIDGRYLIQGLAPGKYTLEFSYVGYQTKKVSDVEVKAGTSVVQDAVMKEAAGQNLKEVVINVSAKKESTAGLYAQIKNSAVVSDGVSADAIRKSPDKNTGDVLKRVSGATIQDNKFVVVRGLNDRYNNATLDNGALPSTEPNRKAFSFDIVPANMVDNIIIKKTASPDMAGDFAGGSVSISTRDIPDSYFLNFAIGSSYNTQATFKPFFGSQLKLGNFLGQPNAAQLSSSFPTQNGIQAMSKQQQISQINGISNDWSVYSYNAMPGQNYQLSVGNLKDFKGGQRLGGIVSFTYRNAENSTPDAFRNFHVYSNYTDDIYKLSTSIGALANLGYSYGSSKITLKNIYNKNYDNQYLHRNGYFNSSGRNIEFYAFDEIQKSLLKTTLEGEHRLGANQSKIKWTTAFSNIVNSQPDQRKVSYSFDPTDQKYYANVSSVGKENARMFSDLNENIYSGELSYSKPVKFLKEAALFKAGVLTQYRKRDFASRFIGMSLQSMDVNEQKAIAARPVGSLYDPALVAQGLYKLEDQSQPGDTYDAHSLTNSAFIMLDNKFGEKLRAVWGVRVEDYKIKLQGSTSATAEVDEDWLDVLPSVNLTYALNSKSNFRLSGSRTIARPEFRELANAGYYDYELLALQKGNPNLKRTFINNADLRCEFFPSAGQIFSVSAFYKNFINAIEPNIYDVNSTVDITYKNADKANVYGAEFEFRKTLDFVSKAGFFKNTSINANASLIKSEAQVVGDDNVLRKRPLAGQSPYVLNAGLQHAGFANKLTFSAMYNRIGRRITKVQGIVFPHVWEDPRDLLDLQLGYKLLNNKAEIKLNVSDILNQRYVMYFDKDLNGKYGATGADETIGRYKPGSNYSISFSYSIR